MSRGRQKRICDRHGYQYALLCFSLAALFVFGSMAGMNFILQKRESRLLQERGTEEVESPVAVWQEPQATGAKEQGEDSEDTLQQLTVEQMEAVISYRANATDEVLHDPVSGQISMEEAFACGERWLVEMGFLEEEGSELKRAQKGEGADDGKEGIVSEDDDSRTLSRRASLGIRKYRKVSSVPMEPYYSFWTVKFSGENVYAVLSINAVTGRVWDAEITLYDEMTQKFSWETLELFTELAGIQADAEDYVETMNDVNAGAVLTVRDSDLQAQMKYYDTAVSVAGNRSADGEDNYSMIRDGSTVVEYYGVQRQRVIEYHLVLRE